MEEELYIINAATSLAVTLVDVILYQLEGARRSGCLLSTEESLFVLEQ
jgi:hypothetical protein